MHILIAPNAFKNSLSAPLVAKALQKGLEQSKLICSTECFPVADGGDGTAALLIEKLKASMIQATVSDPLGRSISSSFGWIASTKTAIVEMASASGLRLLQPQEYLPLQASSYGTGTLLLAALNQGAQKIILAIGGSATVDGGAGILTAMGIRFLDAAGNPIKNMPADLRRLHALDLTLLDKRILNVELMVLCDVDNFLLGQEGAATVFGPQKGANAAMVVQLENALTQFNNVVLKQTGKNMALLKQGGAAGGVAAGLAALLHATLKKGIYSFLELTSFDKSLQNADLVITGEGQIDFQTLQGKAPFGVAQLAREKKIPVIGVAGSIPQENREALNLYFDTLWCINNEPCPLPLAILNTEANLVQTGKLIGDRLVQKK